jgi:hypothetical protein
MRRVQRGRVAWIVALGLAALLALVWWIASGQRADGDASTKPPTDAEAALQPKPILPAPAEPSPLVAETVLAVEPADQPAASEAAPRAADTQPAATLRVLVVDPTAKPVEGARVVTSRWKLPALSTDREGIARFDVLPGETLSVAATHPDFRFARGSIAIDEQPGRVTELRLQLGEGLQVCLEVQARDGRPIDGACVRIQEGWGNADRKEVQLGSMEDLRRSDDLDRTQDQFTEERLTDAHGRCCVNGLRAGPISLHVDAAGFVAFRSKRFDVDADGGDLGVIVLDSAMKLGGIVVDATGPVPGAVVDHMGPMRGRATTDADGRFVLDGQAKIPARVMLHASHPERGQFYSEDLTFTEQPVRIVLEPDIEVRFELTDVQTHERISGTASVEREVPQDYIMLFVYAHPTTFDVSDGRLDLELGYFVESVALRVEDYDLVKVPMATIIADPDRVIELELAQPVNLLVRVHAAGSGELLPQAKLHASQDFHNPKDGVTQHNFLLRTVRFDSEAGGFLVAESDLGVATSDAVRLFAEVQGYAPGAATPIAANGRRICPDTIDIYLEPK